MLASNKKSILKIFTIFFIILNILGLNCYAVVEPTREFYVNDYANLINSSTEQYIINTNLNLYNKTGAQIVVVTVQNLEGKAIEEYATELFRKFGTGNSIKNNGVLMLLALEEREFRIEVGYGLEGCLNDAKTGRIQDQYIIPYLSENNWEAGIKNGFNAIIQIVAEEYGVNVSAEEPTEHSSNTQEVPTIIVIVVFALVLFVFIKSRGRVRISFGGHHRGTYGGYYNRDRGFNSTSRNYSSGSRSSSGSSRSSFGGGGSSGGGGSTRKF